MFDKYLSLGGVDTGPKMFSGGLNPKDLEDKAAGEITAMTATDSVDVHRARAGRDGCEWAVDFEQVVRSFLSVSASCAFAVLTASVRLLESPTISTLAMPRS